MIRKQKWYQFAAEQGHALAQFNLGVMYARGQGVSVDYVIAYMWFNSVAEGNEKARENEEIMVKLMTPSQIAEAQELSRECIKKEYKDCY